MKILKQAKENTVHMRLLICSKYKTKIFILIKDMSHEMTEMYKRKLKFTEVIDKSKNNNYQTLNDNMSTCQKCAKRMYSSHQFTNMSL